MRLSVFRILLAGALLASSTSSLAQNKLDIVEIMRQFILAEYAAKQCLRPDQQTLARSEANRRIVTVRATEEMLKRKPGATARQVAEWYARSTAPVLVHMDEIIRSKGCGDPRIQDLLKRFEIQANLKF